MTAIIIAGGKARRIKKNKAFLRVGKSTIIENQIEILKQIFGHLLIVTNQTRAYRGLGVRTVSDIIREKGSLGGIYSGLIASKNLYNFILACDMPLLQPALITYMIKEIGDHDLVIPQWGDNLEPLHAIYSKRCIHPIEQLLEEDNLKIIDFLGEVKTRTIKQEEILKYDPNRFSFVNINTEEDYRKICSFGLL